MSADYLEAQDMRRLELQANDGSAAMTLSASRADVVGSDVLQRTGLSFAQVRLGRAFEAPHRISRGSIAPSRPFRDDRMVHQVRQKLPAMARLRMTGIAVGAAVAACLATPALAQNEPSTRLVSCGTDSCLLVTGHRQSANAEVRINGHPVVVQGDRSWRVRLPVSTVREWSAPFARKIEVSSYNPAMSAPASRSAKLPIGLLGHVPDLASLVITLN